MDLNHKNEKTAETKFNNFCDYNFIYNFEWLNSSETDTGIIWLRYEWPYAVDNSFLKLSTA